MFAWLHGQQPGQWQGGNRAQQGPWGGGQAAPHVQLNPFDPANYANANGILVTVNALNMAGNIAGEQGRHVQSSDILRASLLQSGVPEPNVENQAHHIVESSNEVGQRILYDYEIESNSAVNGVMLPTAQPAGVPDLTIHLGSHTQEYTDCVNEALNTAIGREQRGNPWADHIAVQQAIVRCLNTIRSILLTEVVPINRRGDADYNPDTDSGMTVREIFRSWGLFD